MVSSGPTMYLAQRHDLSTDSLREQPFIASNNGQDPQTDGMARSKTRNCANCSNGKTSPVDELYIGDCNYQKINGETTPQELFSIEEGSKLGFRLDGKIVAQYCPYYGR